MARYTGPNNKKARRVSFSILENGKDIAKRPYGPGQHGKDRKRKPSNYSVQLTEKQKAIRGLVIKDLLIERALPKIGTKKTPVFYTLTDAGKKWVEEYKKNYPAN